MKKEPEIWQIYAELEELERKARRLTEEEAARWGSCNARHMRRSTLIAKTIHRRPLC